MIATYMVADRWYYVEDATMVVNEFGRLRDAVLWTGWVWVREKKYHTENTVTIIGHTLNDHPNTPKPLDDIDLRRVVLEMRRKLTVKTLRTGPPAYVINEQTLT